MRHAKADRPAGMTDRDRPLTARGRTDAAAIGRTLAPLDPPVGEVISSPARRAVDTAAAVVAAAGWNASVDVADSLYGGGVAEVLRSIRFSTAEVVLLVGHEPTWSATVEALTGAEVRMVTASVAAIEVADGRHGSLLWMLTPRLVGGGPE